MLTGKLANEQNKEGIQIKSTQNKKIEEVKETTMSVEIDVGSEKHYFRAFNWSVIEPVAFSNFRKGFNSI